MSDEIYAGLRADGWSIMEDDGFIDLIGPLWYRQHEGAAEYAILGQAKHRNRRGVVQGGLMMTVADRTCGMSARQAAGVDGLATVQMDTYFVDAAEIGDLIISRPRVLRVTRSLIFIGTELTVGDKVVVTAHGVFKIMRAKPGVTGTLSD